MSLFPLFLSLGGRRLIHLDRCRVVLPCFPELLISPCEVSVHYLDY